MSDPVQTSAPAAPRMSGTLKCLVCIAALSFVWVLEYSTNEALVTVSCIAALIGLVYVLASGRVSPDPASIDPIDDLSRLFTRQRSHFIPSGWLPSHALVFGRSAQVELGELIFFWVVSAADASRSYLRSFSVQGQRRTAHQRLHRCFRPARWIL